MPYNGFQASRIFFSFRYFLQKIRAEINPYHAPSFAQFPYHVVGHIPYPGINGPRIGMACYKRFVRHAQHIIKSGVRQMGNIDHHPKPLHLRHEFPSFFRQSPFHIRPSVKRHHTGRRFALPFSGAMNSFFRHLPNVQSRITYFIRIVPCQRHHPHPQPVQMLQAFHLPFADAPFFHRQQSRYFSLLTVLFDISVTGNRRYPASIGFQFLIVKIRHSQHILPWILRLSQIDVQGKILHQGISGFQLPQIHMPSILRQSLSAPRLPLLV